jgi:hypothetical protein
MPHVWNEMFVDKRLSAYATYCFDCLIPALSAGECHLVERIRPMKSGIVNCLRKIPMKRGRINLFIGLAIYE